MKQRRIKGWMSLLLTAVLLLTLAAPLAAAAESQTIAIQTVEDLETLSKNCTVDRWSQGKTVVLENDLDLKGRDFTPIPTFGGIFQGQGHKIINISITGSGNVRGLFRYIQSSGVVQDLTVAGTIQPQDRQDDLGLLAGSNSGKLRNCSATGTVSGDNRIGGLVGSNAAGGEIISCSFSGTVTGKHFAGGIAGENQGTLTLCQNHGSINTKNLEDNPKTDYTNLEQLNSMENVPVYTDIGGIAGLSSGVIQSCRNEGSVGYEQIGCNIGGIAGRSSGYLDGCVNTGAINGRKDVGGIAGQLEPEVVQSFSKDFLDKLLDQLEQMQDLMDRTANDADGISNAVSSQLDDLSEKARTTKEIAGDLVDSMTDWANGNIDQINELSARVSWTLDQLSPIMDETVTTMGELEDVLDELETIRKDLKDASTAGGNAAEDLQNAIGALKSAVSMLKNMTPAVRQAIQELLDAIVNGEDPTDAVSQLVDALDGLNRAYGKVNEALNKLDSALGNLSSMSGALNRTLEDMETVHDATETALDSLTKITKDLRDMVKELAEKPDITIAPIGSDITDQGDALQAAMDALLDSGDALNQLLNDSSDTLVNDLRAINNQFRAITNLIRSEKADWSDDRSKDLEDQLKDHFQDLSDQCNLEKQHDGRISASQNQGTVYGTTQVGGIAGSVGIEADFDVDEDVNRVGEYSLDYHYQAKALVYACINSGEVTSKKDAAGGVVGQAYLGQINGCEGYGTVTSTDGSYVGGIAGSFEGSIRRSWAKCSLSGTDYIGGIAGYGSTLEDCHTLVQITAGDAYVGAVAGDVDTDDDATVARNTFTHETLGALDGISYVGKAEPVSFDTLCTTAGVPKTFAQLELTFQVDGKVLEVVPFQYGKGIDSLPEIPAKKGYSASWPEVDYRHLTASQTLEAVYTPYQSSLSDGGALPQILVDGSFSASAVVSHTTQPASWTDEKGNAYEGTAYTVTVKDPDLKEISYTVHYRLPDSGKRYVLWVQTENGWEQQESTVDGSYLLFPSTASEVTFCVIEKQAGALLPVVLLLTALVVLAAVILLLRRKRHRRKNRA